MAAAGEEEKQQVEARIEGALQSRLQYFKENDSSITMASVRRLLEEDLGFKKYALDVHKKFIKQFIEENLYCDDSGFKNSEENVGKHAGPSVGEEMESPKKHENDRELKGPTHKHEPNTEEDSPIMGLLTPKAETVDPQAIEISESTIKKAILERADHIKANSEALTMAEARRLLEEDLGLHKNSLEPFKKFIRKQIEEVLEPPRVSKSASGRKKEGSRHCPSGEGRSRPKDRQNNEVEDTANMRGGTMQSGEDEKSNRLKRCRIENEPDKSTKKSKIAKKQADENSEAENDGASEDSGSQSPAEKPPKKKPISTPGYGKHVEHLKSVIKACGMSVPPSVYKKVKQVSDNKREYFLAKELEDILSKEGLSSNPTEKEIKEVRKRKDTAKELEGIDLSNIVTSSRRRSMSSFMAPPAHERKDSARNNAKATKKDEKVRSSNSDKDIEDDGQKKDDKVKNSNSDKDSRDGSKKVEDDKVVVQEEEDDDDEEEEDDDDDDSESEEFNEGDDESD